LLGGLCLPWGACHREHRCPPLCHFLPDRSRHFVLAAPRQQRSPSEAIRTAARRGCCRCVTALLRQRRRRPRGRHCEESPCGSERARQASRHRQTQADSERETSRQKNTEKYRQPLATHTPLTWHGRMGQRRSLHRRKFWARHACDRSASRGLVQNCDFHYKTQAEYIIHMVHLGGNVTATGAQS
jgi:hypothetical protein